MRGQFSGKDYITIDYYTTNQTYYSSSLIPAGTLRLEKNDYWFSIVKSFVYFFPISSGHYLFIRHNKRQKYLTMLYYTIPHRYTLTQAF